MISQKMRALGQALSQGLFDDYFQTLAGLHGLPLSLSR